MGKHGENRGIVWLRDSAIGWAAIEEFHAPDFEPRIKAKMEEQIPILQRDRVDGTLMEELED